MVTDVTVTDISCTRNGWRHIKWNLWQTGATCVCARARKMATPFFCLELAWPPLSGKRGLFSLYHHASHQQQANGNGTAGRRRGDSGLITWQRRSNCEIEIDPNSKGGSVKTSSICNKWKSAVLVMWRIVRKPILDDALNSNRHLLALLQVSKHHCIVLIAILVAGKTNCD